MTRQEVYDDIKETFGEVPSFFDKMPDDVLELEWKLLKRIEIDEGPIPGKYRELIGLAVGAAVGCDDCIYVSEKGARLGGATEEEIEYALLFAKSMLGWAFLNRALQVPSDEFRALVDRSFDYMMKKSKAEELRRAA